MLCQHTVPLVLYSLYYLVYLFLILISPCFCFNLFIQFSSRLSLCICNPWFVLLFFSGLSLLHSLCATCTWFAVTLVCLFYLLYHDLSFVFTICFDYVFCFFWSSFGPFFLYYLVYLDFLLSVISALLSFVFCLYSLDVLFVCPVWYVLPSLCL